MNSPRNLIAASVFLLVASGVFGVLNEGKVQTLRAQFLRAESQREAAERQRASLEKRATAPAMEGPGNMKAPDNESRVASAEAELVKTQTEKSDLQAKLQANEAQISDLQKRLEQFSKSPPNPNPGAPSVSELQAQLDDARRQLESAEEEKAFVTERARPGNTGTPAGPEVAVKRPNERAVRPSVRGTVLAVNQAYNFVVLNLGNRQGLQANAEMLVLRGGSLIGKIRISSVEPATSIGDILGNSLARGVQVQPGDTVIYAGSNS